MLMPDVWPLECGGVHRLTCIDAHPRVASSAFPSGVAREAFRLGSAKTIREADPQVSWKYSSGREIGKWV
jgi:hypothetical protein